MKGAPTPVPSPFHLSQTFHGPTGTPTARNQDEDYFNSKPASELASTWGSTQGDRAHAFVDDVPNEIITHILELAYFSEESPNDTFRSAISQTSFHFRRIALTTPSLWSKYYLTQGNVYDYLPHLPRYLELSKQYPLEIHLSCFWSGEMTQQAMDLFLPHSHRWRHLSITTPNANIFSFLVNVPAPILRTISLSHFSSERRLSLDHPVFGGYLPSLTHLYLRNVSLDKANISLRNLTKIEVRGYGTWPSFPGLHDLLGGSETLQNLVVHVKPALALLDMHRQAGQEPIVLPALRTFTVFTSEWLTDDIARLIHTFKFPNLDTLVVQDGSGLGSTTSRGEIVRYSSTPIPSMKVAFADILVACRCLPSEQLEKLNTLEITRAVWSNYASLQTIFRSMTSLENLVIFELNPLNVFEDLEVGDLVPFFIPSLRTLDINLIRDFRPPHEELARFIRLFSLPSLTSLILRHLSRREWESIVSCFTSHAANYPRLTSLTVAAMHDCAVPISQSPVDAFPHLRSLYIIDAPSNMFLSCLASPQSERDLESVVVPWPGLESVMICGDPQASKPLLHKIIDRRQAIGKPFAKLFLDGAFRANLESWEWITERVEVVEMPSIDSRQC